MPFARPASHSLSSLGSPSSSASTSTTTLTPNETPRHHSNSSSDLLTVYDAAAHQEQLESMTAEAASSSSSPSSNRASPAPLLSVLPLLRTPTTTTTITRSMADGGDDSRSSSLPSDHAQRPTPSSYFHSSHHSITTIGRSSKTVAVHDGGNSSSSSSSSCSGSTGSTSGSKAHLTRKQRLFQISDDEQEGESVRDEAAQEGLLTKEGSTGRAGETVDKDVDGNEDDDDDDDDEALTSRLQAEAWAKLRAARNEPIRRSISALSGVTVIGKGGREREGSTSTIGSFKRTTSNRGSVDHSRNGSLSVDAFSSDDGGKTSDDVATTEQLPPSSTLPPAQTSPEAVPPRSSDVDVPHPDPPFAPTVGSSMDLPGARNLLQRYDEGNVPIPPTTSDPKADTDSSGRARPPLPRSVSAFVGEPPASSFDTSQSPLVSSQSFAEQAKAFLPSGDHQSQSYAASSSTASSSGASTRRHSRSSIHDVGRRMFPLSPITPCEPLSQASQVLSPSNSNFNFTTATTAAVPSPYAPSTIPPSTSRASSLASSSQERTSSRDSRAPSFSTFALDTSTAIPAGPQSATLPRSSSQFANNQRHPHSRTTSRSTSREYEGDLSRSRSASRSIISPSDLNQIMRSFNNSSSFKPRKSTSRHTSTADLTALGTDSAGSATTPNRPTVDQKDGSEGGSELRRSLRSRDGSTTDLKTLIQHKRRQASAPFYTSATVRSGAASPAISQHSGRGSPVLDSTLAFSPAPSEVRPLPDTKQPWEFTPPRRARSRHGTSMGLNGLTSFTAPPDGPVTHGFEVARLQALRGMGEVVMTPSVEEWKQLGLAEDLHKGEEDDDDGGSDSSEGDEDDTTESSEDDGRGDRTIKAQTQADQTGSRPSTASSLKTFSSFYGSMPPKDFNLTLNRSHTTPPSDVTRTSSLKKSPRNKRISLLQSPDMSSSSDNEYNSEKDTSATSPALHNNRVLPTLSRQSLSAPTGSPLPGFSSPHEASTPDGQKGEDARRGSILAPNAMPPQFLSRAPSPVPLTSTGPIDPRSYSAVTGLRDINSFVVEAEAGKGAYGLVRKVRERDANGVPFGPDLMLKYIVKQRILADAYKRHKVLGAIPMEIHVLDHIRRVYRPPPQQPVQDPVQAASAFTMSPGSPSLHHPPIPGQILVGHPNLCGMLDFFEDAENYYLVMACFGNGQDLFDYVDAAPTGLSVQESRSILAQIVDGVSFLHMHGIAHRDIKDENIILDGKGGVQLIDFGSAAYIKEGKPYFDTFSGTLDFASPEVLRGERYGGRETDIWALGVLAYVILCGECPFWTSEESLAGLTPTSRATQALHAKAEITDESLPPNMTAEQAQDEANEAIDFVHQCLQTHARDRPSAVHLKQHRFLAGGRGWLGRRGWEEAVEDDDDDDDDEDEDDED